MDNASFESFRKIIYDKSGISIGPGKKTLIHARIHRRIRHLGLHDYQEYLSRIMHDDTGEEIYHFLDAISTNVTSFFRHQEHYEFLGEQMKDWLSQGQRRFRFWSAACSTGEEPYSLAMKLMDISKGKKVDIKILATDISLRVLQEAIRALYDQERLHSVPKQYRFRFFLTRQDRDKKVYEIKEEIKRLISFKRLNLSYPPFPMKGPFDAVLCCNVLIYFDKKVQSRLIPHICRLLKPGGFLFTGYTESVKDFSDELEVIKPSVYRKK